jgi:Ca-activated chloride channel family protein
MKAQNYTQKKVVKGFFLTIVLFFNAAYLLAQKTITGTVSDETGPLPGVNVFVKGSTAGVTTDFSGKYSIIAHEGDFLVFSYVGYNDVEKEVGKNNIIDVVMTGGAVLDEVVVTSFAIKRNRLFGSTKGVRIRGRNSGYQEPNNESYSGITENIFKSPQKEPLSTFSIDVDRASYSNVRRMIQNGEDIPKDAVKIEEFINYFHYDYAQPKTDDPFAIYTEVAQCPWNDKHQLVKIGLQGKVIPQENLPAANLVFLLDVSGSMNSANKLPLVKSVMKLLVNQLREKDKVSIVVYAGAAGVVLKPTSGINKSVILEALDNLSTGGSTAGGAGIKLAYDLAQRHFIEGGNNRVILATDGDFNVGISSEKDLEQLIVNKRETGIFLTVLGFGRGNYKDNKMETLADKGNGNHAYIDTMKEAQKVFGEEFGGTLNTIAKDVKLQVEFNPLIVQGYRLIGYENRLLNDEDFEDDTKDAGELGSGHTVTALYEIIPHGVDSQFTKKIPTLKYSKRDINNNFDNELLTVKFRYKKPNERKSKLLEKTIPYEVISFENTSADFQFASAVAMFGMLLRESEFVGETNYENVLEIAKKSKGNDENGYRSEFIQLVKTLENSL